MRTERRKATRHPFIARAEIIDERENARTSSKISDLSLSGCFVEIGNPFPEGTAVVIEIYTEDEMLEAHGTVARRLPRCCIGCRESRGVRQQLLYGDRPFVRGRRGKEARQ